MKEVLFKMIIIMNIALKKWMQFKKMQKMINWIILKKLNQIQKFLNILYNMNNIIINKKNIL